VLAKDATTPQAALALLALADMLDVAAATVDADAQAAVALLQAGRRRTLPVSEQRTTMVSSDSKTVPRQSPILQMAITTEAMANSTPVARVLKYGGTPHCVCPGE